MKPKYNILAARWGEENGFDVVRFVVSEEAGEVYYLHRSNLTGKNGLPQFIRINSAGNVEDSFNWPYELINRYARLLRYIDNEGREWKSYQEYCNSDAPDFDTICVMLDTGRRTPQNEWEKEYLRKSQEYKEKGIATELPFD